MSYRGKKGFTLVEMMVVIVIITIISSFIARYIVEYTAQQRGEVDIADFWMDFKSLRAKVLKGGAPVLVTFDYANNSYDIFIDSNGDGVADSSEIQPKTYSADLVFGIPTPQPGSAAPGAADLNIVSTSWKDGITIQNNSTLTFPAGYIYLQNTARPQYGYCLSVKDGDSEVQFYKWNGSKWYKF